MSQPSTSTTTNRSKAARSLLVWAKQQQKTLPTFDTNGNQLAPLDRDKWPHFTKYPPNITLSNTRVSCVNSKSSIQDAKLASTRTAHGWMDDDRLMKADGNLETLYPEEFRLHLTPIIFWAPHIFFRHALENGKPPCPLCRSSKNVVNKGWSPQLRRVCGLGCTHMLYGARYSCTRCPGKMRVAAHLAVGCVVGCVAGCAGCAGCVVGCVVGCDACCVWCAGCSCLVCWLVPLVVVCLAGHVRCAGCAACAGCAGCVRCVAGCAAACAWCVV
jgi:hypothetical protein